MTYYFTQEINDGKHSLHAFIIITEEELLVYLGGGQKAHIGSIVLCQPRKSLKGNGSISCTSSVFNLVGHKDDLLALPLGERLCKDFNKVVVVVGGIHIKDACEEDFLKVEKNANLLVNLISYRLHVKGVK